MLSIDGVEMVDVREAAQIANRSAETIRRWIWSGRLDARRRGNRLLVSRSDLERLAGKRTQASDPPPSLRDWASRVRDERRADRLGEQSRYQTAADLVLADRAERDAV
jgi:excisionase family DNA binding protein